MWKDTTSYSRDDKERKPDCFTAKSGKLTITVTCGHIHYRGVWIMHCFKLGIDTLELKNCTSLEEAKMRAISIVKSEFSQLSSDANKFDV